MPLELDQEIVRRNEANLKLLDDRNISGGLHTVANLVDRDSILGAQRKPGMLVWVQAALKMYQLQSDLSTWLVYAADPAGGQDGAPTGYALLIGNDSLAAWMRITAADVLVSLTNGTGPIINFTNNGLIEVGAPLQPTWSFNLSRLPLAAFRNNAMVAATFQILDVNTATALVQGTSTLAIVVPIIYADTVLNVVYRWLLQIGDALRTPLALSFTQYTLTRGAIAFLGPVLNSATFVPNPGPPFFTDDFEAYATDAALPQGLWYTSGNTGTGQQLVKTTFPATGSGVVGTPFVPHQGTKQLFLGNLSGAVLIPVSGRRHAKIDFNFNAFIPGQAIRLSFWKRQLGNDAITFDGFDLNLIDTGGVLPPVGNALLFHEETNATDGWVFRSTFLSAWVGRTITLDFSLYDDAAAGDPMAMLFDEVLVEIGTVTVPPIPPPGSITEAYIESTLTFQPLVATKFANAMAINVNLVTPAAEMMVAYPSALPQPSYIRRTQGSIVDYPLSLYDTNIPVTNFFAVTNNYSVYLSPAINSPSVFNFEVRGFPPLGNYFAMVMSDNPYLYWRFDDAPQGLVAADASGNGRNGVISVPGALNTALGITTDINNGSLACNLSPNDSGVTRNLTGAGLGPPTAIGQAYTLEWWFSAFSLFPVPGRVTNFVGTVTPVPVTGQFGAFINPVGTFDIGWSGGATLSIPVFPTFAAASGPNHVVAVFSFTELKLYANGALVGQVNTPAPAGPNYTTIGFPRSNVSLTEEWLFNSRFDEAAFYTHELTAAQVLAHYAAGIAVLP